MRKIRAINEQFTCAKGGELVYSGYLVEVSPGSTAKWCDECVNKIFGTHENERTRSEVQEDNARRRREEDQRRIAQEEAERERARERARLRIEAEKREQRKKTIATVLVISVIIGIFFLVKNLLSKSSAADDTSPEIDLPITSLIIPANVTTIGEKEYMNSQLTEVIFSTPSKVTSIGSSAFQGNDLSSIIIPNSVTHIGINAFANNPITSVSIGANVTLDWSGNIGVLGENTGFNGAYDRNNSKAGTYTRQDTKITTWTYSSTQQTAQMPVAPTSQSVQQSAQTQPAATPQRPVSDSLVRIQGGTFTMGSPSNEPGRSSYEVQHQVTVSGFYMGKYEVTQKEYQAVMGTNPSNFKGDNNPVEQVSWYEAIEYCNRLSQREGLRPAYTVNGTTVTWNKNTNGYRLPTEAEWEYACRAGTRTAYNNSASINDNTGWYGGNSGGKTHPVGQKPANAWGLYDMHGNVYEWCWDLYGSYPSGARTDPEGERSGPGRVARGGGWDSHAMNLRSADRRYSIPSHLDNSLGFRIVRPLETTTVSTQPAPASTQQPVSQQQSTQQPPQQQQPASQQPQPAPAPTQQPVVQQQTAQQPPQQQQPVSQQAQPITGVPSALASPITPEIIISTHPVSRNLTAGSINGSLTVAASVTQNAMLGYQWYSNTTENNIGGNAINGATNASYAIPANLTAGTYYFYCVVSASGGATSVRSRAATVTVATR